MKRRKFRKSLILGGLVLCLIQPQIIWGQSRTLGLHDLLQLAIQKNPQIRVQQKEKQIARFQSIQSLTRLLPQADAEASYVKVSERNGVPDFVAANGTIEKIAWLSFYQPLFDSGQILNVLNNRLAQKKQNTIYQKAKQDVLLQVIDAYFTALKTKGEIKIYEKNLKAFKLLYKQSKLLFENGLVPELDVKKSRVEYLLQENKLARAEKNFQAALNYIRELVGLPMADSFSLREFSKGSVRLDSLSNYLRTALINRPELRILKFESHQYLNQKRMTYLQHLPSANLTAYYGWDTNNQLQPQNRGWQVSLNLQMPLWHWGSLHRERQVASLKYQQSEILGGQIRKQITQQVINSFNECKIQIQQMEAMRESEKEAKEAVRMAKLGYQTGTVTSLDVINTQKLFTETQVNYLVSVYDFYMAKAHLYRNIGKLTEDFSWLK